MTGETVDTPLGRFLVEVTGARSGIVGSETPVQIGGHAYSVATRWRVAGADRHLVVSSLGLLTTGTWMQGTRGNWYKEAARELARVLQPHIEVLLDTRDGADEEGP